MNVGPLLKTDVTHWFLRSPIGDSNYLGGPVSLMNFCISESTTVAIHLDKEVRSNRVYASGSFSPGAPIEWHYGQPKWEKCGVPWNSKDVSFVGYSTPQ